MAVTWREDSVLVELLRASAGRQPKFLRLKLKRMSLSAFSFFRGACALFAHDWQDLHPPDPGPELLVCGDLHLENFGAYRDDDGDFRFDINDFDEAILGPCSIDPVRCATSILLAAEEWALSPLHANGLVLAYLDEYRAAVTTPVHARAIDAEAPRLSSGPIGQILGKTALGTQSELLDHHTQTLKDGSRRIDRRRRRHPSLPTQQKTLISAAVEEYGIRKGLAEVFQVIDASWRIAGIGSLGVERYLVLIAGGGSAETNRLIDVKAMNPSVWIDRGGRNPTPPPTSEAARAVVAQRALQASPTAGLDVLPIDGVDFRVREMIPEENRPSLDRFQEKPKKLRQAIVAAGRLTGLAHLRVALTAGATEALADWARGPALDSVLAAAARFAEKTRLGFKQFRTEIKAPESLPDDLREALSS